MNAPAQPELILCEVGETGIDCLESYSPFCIKVHRALRLAGLDYTSRHGRHPGAFKRLNPSGQVPVLLVNGEPVADSTRILERIEVLAPDALGPALDARTRARARLWEELADTSLNGFVVAARWADDRNWPRTKTALFANAPQILCAIITPRLRANVVKQLVARDVWRAGEDACWERFEQMLDQLDDRAPTDGFWVSQHITVADIAIYAQLHSIRCELTPWQAERIAERRRLTAYLDAVGVATRAPRRKRVSRRDVELVALLTG